MPLHQMVKEGTFRRDLLYGESTRSDQFRLWPITLWKTFHCSPSIILTPRKNVKSVTTISQVLPINPKRCVAGKHPRVRRHSIEAGGDYDRFELVTGKRLLIQSPGFVSASPETLNLDEVEKVRNVKLLVFTAKHFKSGR